MRPWVIAALLLALFTGSLAAGGRFAPDTRVNLFEPGTGRWILATFAQTKPGSEFYSNNHLYHVDDRGEAQVVSGVSSQLLFEADRPCDNASRRPQRGDVVQVLGKDPQNISHAVLSSVQAPATIRFEGKAYTISPDKSLSDAGVVSSAENRLQHVEVTKSAAQHIVDRHLLGGSKNAGASVFKPGEDVLALIKDAELATPVPESNGYVKRDFDAGRTIAYYGLPTKPTSKYTVIATPSGKLVTAYPVGR